MKITNKKAHRLLHTKTVSLTENVQIENLLLKILSRKNFGLRLGLVLGLEIERKEMKLKYTIKSRNSKRRWVKSEIK